MPLSPKDTAFPQGSLVLVTGSNGFIGSHIADQALRAGYHVRGTVRDASKVEWTTKLFAERHGAGKYSAVVVPDMAVEGAFDDAVKGVQGIIHSASVVSFSPDPAAVIPQTILGVTTLLRSAARAPSVKSFVLTSSSVAVANPTPDNSPSRIDADSWNDAAIAEAWSVTSAPFPDNAPTAVYSASKAESEKALWDFVEKEKPSFRVNAILPDANFGAVLNTDAPMSTGGWIRGVFAGNVDFVKLLLPAWYINVADTARLHVAALLNTKVKNERIFGFAGPYTWNGVLAILRSLYPGKTFPEDLPVSEISKMSVPNERAEELLKEVFGKGWVSFEESVKENVAGME
ncbi:hypothetical protein V496_04927 [Pseudogymnoascus sp. VKM F-4515 (FW-2607)]|nr:hypothetical protein V496_04927 [Pseudogymnoascus sp. VKM F-4515 (FW-2607)]KFY91007.1 hypothetical protein V498_05712 [Pseudogymnoascus sp. VKM F-4517 (FW-2822)]